MIERKFVAQNFKEFQIKEYVASQLSRVGLSDVKLQRTPLGEKIIVSANRPGLVVGRGGSNIQKLTKTLKENFKLENPQIEIEEITETGKDAAIVAEGIANTMERFGSNNFKSAGHKAMRRVMDDGALGVEILISGKIPSQRARTWRFYQGYLKKCGDIALTGVKTAYTTAHLKTGSVGIIVRIMPGDTELPDHIKLNSEIETVVEEVEEKVEEVKEEKKEEKTKKKSTKKTAKKTTKKSSTKKKEEKLETTDESKEKVSEKTEEVKETKKEEASEEK
jgi:small subunit ribosomal protein S3